MLLYQMTYPSKNQVDPIMQYSHIKQHFLSHDKLHANQTCQLTKSCTILMLVKTMYD